MRLTLPAVCVLCVATFGCGGVETAPSLAEAVERTEGTGSSRIQIDATESASGSPGAIRCEGVADYSRERSRLLCGDYGDFVAIEDTLYIRGSVLMTFGTGERWLKLRDADVASSIRDLSPVTLLRTLRDASSETEVLGKEEVRGVPTSTYRLTVDCEKAEIDCEGETAAVDVWIDESGLVRRVFLDAGGAAGTIEFFDFGVEADIEPPPDEVVDDIDRLTPGPCAGGGSPVTDTAALGALRRYGFTMERDDACAGQTVSVLVGAERSSSDTLIVTCRLYETTQKSAPSAPRTRRSPASARFASRTSIARSSSPRTGVVARHWIA